MTAAASARGLVHGVPQSCGPQRPDAIKWAMPYPPRMTAAKLPATTARRNAAVMVYSIEDSVRPKSPPAYALFGGQIVLEFTLSLSLRPAPIRHRNPVRTSLAVVTLERSGSIPSAP